MKKHVILRSLTNLLAIGLCLVLIYIFLGSPALTPRTAYSRVEKANLVGPGEVLTVVKPEGQAYSHLVLARDQTGVMLYAWDFWDRDLRSFVYLEDPSDLVLAAAPGQELLWVQRHALLPVYLFDQMPQASHAELELRIHGDYEGDPYDFTYQLSAPRTAAGIFSFLLRSDQAEGAEGYAFFQLRNATGNSAADLSGTAIEAAVQLYDGDGSLLAERTLLP